MIIQGKR